eukprot:Pgem_evm1s18903
MKFTAISLAIFGLTQAIPTTERINFDCSKIPWRQKSRRATQKHVQGGLEESCLYSFTLVSDPFYAEKYCPDTEPATMTKNITTSKKCGTESSNDANTEILKFLKAEGAEFKKNVKLENDRKFQLLKAKRKFRPRTEEDDGKLTQKP